jgi:hypothetical protein
MLAQSGQTLTGASPSPSPGRFGLIASIGPWRAMLPAKSRIRQSLLPGARRQPRPTICTYSPADLVGRSMAIRSTPGALKPVVSTLALVRQRISPRLKASISDHARRWGLADDGLAGDAVRADRVAHMACVLDAGAEDQPRAAILTVGDDLGHRRLGDRLPIDGSM